jgi:hypothetical protein
VRRWGLIWILKWLVVAATLYLAACASIPPAPELALDLRSQYHISDVIVSVPADGSVSWSDADREYVAGLEHGSGQGSGIVTGSLGVSSLGLKEKGREVAASSPAGLSFVHAKASSIVKTAVEADARAALGGPHPANLRVAIKTLTIVSTAEGVLTGNSHVLETEVWLEDPESGRALTPRIRRSVTVDAGISSVIADGFSTETKPDPVTDLAGRHRQSVVEWLSPGAARAY